MKFDLLQRKKSDKQVRKYFDEIATLWDSMRKEFYSDAVRDKILSMIYPEPGHIIADIGAGTGFLSEGLIDKPASIIAIDQSREMLSQMKMKMRDSSRIDYRVGNANNLPVRDSIVDFALANMYLHHVDDPQKALSEIFRILTRGGTLVMTDLEAHKYKFLADEHHDRWLGFEHEDINDWLREIGFENVNVSSLEEYCCSTSVNKNKIAKISIFLATGQKP